MTIILNKDKEHVARIAKKLEESDGFCPCRIDRSEDTRCVCKEFRDNVKDGVAGPCHCGLYIAVP